MNNTIEFEAGGKVRGITFGPYALRVSCAMHSKTLGYNCTLNSLLNSVAAGNSELAATHYIYGAAVNYCVQTKKDVDFTPADVMEWLFELGHDGCKELFDKAKESPEKPKNSSSPKETGETILSKT